MVCPGRLRLLIAGAGIVALLEVAGLGRRLIIVQTQTEAAVPALTGSSSLAGMCARFAVAAAGIVFVPTVFLGAAFPLALRLIVTEFHEMLLVGSLEPIELDVARYGWALFHWSGREEARRRPPDTISRLGTASSRSRSGSTPE